MKLQANIDVELLLPLPVIIADDGLIEISGEGDIYYTTNGLNPDFRSDKYTRKFTVDNDCYVKAVSYNGLFYSNISTLQVKGKNGYQTESYGSKYYYNNNYSQNINSGPYLFYSQFLNWTLYIDIAMCETYEDKDICFFQTDGNSYGGFRFGFRGTDTWKVYPFILFFDKDEKIIDETEFKFCLLDRYKSSFKLMLNSDGKLGVMNYNGRVIMYDFDKSRFYADDYNIPTIYIGTFGGFKYEDGKKTMITRNGFIHINDIKTESRCNNDFSEYLNTKPRLVSEILSFEDGFIKSYRFGNVSYKYNDKETVMYDFNHILEAEQPVDILSKVDYFGTINTKTETLGYATEYEYQEQDKIGDIITEEQTLYTTTDLLTNHFLSVDVLEATDDTPVISFLIKTKMNKVAGFKLYNTKYATLSWTGAATTKNLQTPINGQKIQLICNYGNIYLFYGLAFVDTGITIKNSLPLSMLTDATVTLNNKVKLLSYAVRTGLRMLYYPSFYK